MAKAPLIRQVKTRLVPPLTLADAAGLSACFIRDTTENIARLASSNTFSLLDGFVAYTPIEARELVKELLPPAFRLLEQRGNSLGERLLNATADMLSMGYDSLCLLNSDSPTLPRRLLRDAVSYLALSGDRVVLGESDDGGYYLIGLKHAHRALFEGIAWSTPDVLAQTIRRASDIELDIQLLPAWYDVDDASSLRRLCEELISNRGKETNGHEEVPYAAPHTRHYLLGLLRDRPVPATTGLKTS